MIISAAILLVWRRGELAEKGRCAQQAAEAHPPPLCRHGTPGKDARDGIGDKEGQDDDHVGEECMRAEDVDQEGGKQRPDDGADRPEEQRAGGNQRMLAGCGMVVGMGGTQRIERHGECAECKDADEIEKLHRLKELGVITAEDFIKSKNKFQIEDLFTNNSQYVIVGLSVKDKSIRTFNVKIITYNSFFRKREIIVKEET